MACAVRSFENINEDNAEEMLQSGPLNCTDSAKLL
jgi:hypothetical protein